jgi:hypothetical protein
MTPSRKWLYFIKGRVSLRSTWTPWGFCRLQFNCLQVLLVSDSFQSDICWSGLRNSYVCRFCGVLSVYVTIAPVPLSITASISAWNVTFAGFLATASVFTFSTSTVSESYSSTFTLGGGTLPTSMTLGGLQIPQSTAATAPTTKTGSNTSGTEGGRLWVALL